MKLQPNDGDLHGFTPAASRQREHFLRDARTYLNALSHVLTLITQLRLVRLRRLPTSLGSAGGVTAELQLGTHQTYLVITIATSNCVAHTQRPDRVVLTIQYPGTPTCTYHSADQDHHVIGQLVMTMLQQGGMHQ